MDVQYFGFCFVFNFPASFNTSFIFIKVEPAGTKEREDRSGAKPTPPSQH